MGEYTFTIKWKYVSLMGAYFPEAIEKPVQIT